MLRLEFPYRGLVHQVWKWHLLPSHSIRLKYQWEITFSASFCLQGI